MKTIEVPQGNISKAQENEIIDSFYAALPEDSYLKAIFKGMPEYCKEQIRDDFGISPFESLEDRSQEISKLEKQLSELETERDNLIKEKEKQQKTYNSIFDEQAHANEDLSHQLGQAFNELEQRDKEIEQAKSDAEQSSLLILKLKARIFDLQENNLERRAS